MDMQRHDGTTAFVSSSLTKVSTEDLTRLVALAPDALLVVNQAGTIVMANEQASALFSYSVEQVIGRPLEFLLPDRQRTTHIAHRQQFMNQPKTRSMDTGLDLVGLGQDDREFPVDVSLRPVLLDERLLIIAAVRDMSQQRHIERERDRQVAQNRLQAELLDLAHDAIIVRDPLSRVTFWNRGAEDLYGWSANEVQGHISHSLLQTRFPLDLAAIDATLEQDGHWAGELIHTRRDGRIVIVESRWALLRDEQGQSQAIMEINRDITWRRQLERAAQAMQTETSEHLSFLQQVIDALPGCIYLVSGSQGRLLLTNQAATSYWGAEWPLYQPMQEFLATAGLTLLNEQGLPLQEEQFATLRAVRQGETVFSQQETIHRSDGTALSVLVSAVPLPVRTATGLLTSTSEPVALVVHQDISVVKQAESLKDEFIGIAAHELRNPLAALKGYASMLLYQSHRLPGSQLSPWQQEVVDEIVEATTRLDKLTEDLLDVTRLQAGRLFLTRQPTDLVALTRHMLEQVQMSSDHHHLALHSSLSSLKLEIDRMRIEQVLNNLLNNAVKYSPQGGEIEVTLHLEEKPPMVLLAIRDGGIGIPADQQSRIFGRFVRAENARATQITGTGLGLFLSRELVERHGGHLWFESREGAGTTFFLSLPLSERSGAAE